ncbi:MAG TPA: hypothetical protein VMM56_15735 [Planctomycetaceae bacterium]|nr:hypothetical protein [Planctomycetaceae bacterium]
MPPRLLLRFIAVAVLSPVSSGEAQSRQVEISKRCVDQIDQRSGPTLYGAILGRSADGTLTIAVQREWLQKKSKSFYTRQTATEAEDSINALATLRDRIDEWLKTTTQPINLVRYLREQFEQVDQKLAEAKQNPVAPNSQFVILEIPAKNVQKWYAQPAQNRQLALAAWKLNLKDVETKSAEDLADELQDRKVDLIQLDLDLSDRLSARADGEREWAARRAIVEHHFWRSIEFQGTASFLFEAGAGADQPELLELLPKIFNQELTRQLGDLLGSEGGVPQQKADSIVEATKTADDKNVFAVVITRLDQSLAEKRVSVEKLLLAKMPGGEWERVWSIVTTVDASKPRKAIEDELANHEQIKPIRDAVKALGLPGGDENLTIAIRFGAATMEAQEKSGEAFEAFVKRYVEELDRPPLILGN